MSRTSQSGTIHQVLPRHPRSARVAATQFRRGYCSRWNAEFIRRRNVVRHLHNASLGQPLDVIVGRGTAGVAKGSGRWITGRVIPPSPQISVMVPWSERREPANTAPLFDRAVLVHGTDQDRAA